MIITLQGRRETVASKYIRIQDGGAAPECIRCTSDEDVAGFLAYIRRTNTKKTVARRTRILGQGTRMVTSWVAVDMDAWDHVAMLCEAECSVEIRWSHV